LYFFFGRGIFHKTNQELFLDVTGLKNNHTQAAQAYKKYGNYILDAQLLT
jgi:hypothetical protein